MAARRAAKPHDAVLDVQGANNICGIKAEATGGPKALTMNVVGNTIQSNNASGGYSIELYGLNGAIVTGNTFKETGSTPASNGILTDTNCRNCVLFPNNDQTGGMNSIGGSGHQYLGNAGALANPTYSFFGDPNTGLLSAGADTLGFVTGGVQTAFVDGNGIGSAAGVRVSGGTQGLGYVAGAGGSVTQLTSKSTAVVLNKPCGKIITHNVALGAGAQVQFNLQNSVIQVGDTVIANHNADGTSGGGTNNAYEVRVRCITNGFCVINLNNISGGSLGEAVHINFAVIKGASS